MSDIESINLKDVEDRILQCNNLDDLDSIRVEYLGKSGKLTSSLKMLAKMDANTRSKQGAVLNQLKAGIFKAIKSRQNNIEQKLQNQKLLQDSCDITLPGYKQAFAGSIHPVMQTRHKLEKIFTQVGFSLIDNKYNSEVETDYYNFTALNIPEYHPARAMHDTFYLRAGGLLRTHTSSMQIKVLKQNQQLPLRVISSGKVFRCDSDQTHTPMFHQMEGLVVDQSSTFAELKWLIQNVLNSFFEQAVELRFRSSFFPFTEPSAEVDIKWPLNGKKQTWLEVLGCGMVHPNVLKSCDVDADLYQGYAFGFGLDRLTMLKYNITDLRDLFVGDISFLEQFS